MQAGEIVNLSEKESCFVTEGGERVPLGSVLQLKGLEVRQEVDGMKGWSNPPPNFWRVTLEEREGVIGVVLPEGDEDWFMQFEGREEPENFPIHHPPTFVPLQKCLFDKDSTLVALPAE